MGTIILENPGNIRYEVSIQLMSPASGNLFLGRIGAVATSGFHSINVPSEWEQNKGVKHVLLFAISVSIQLMSPASGNLHYWKISQKAILRFHSINVPSEWELMRLLYEA